VRWSRTPVIAIGVAGSAILAAVGLVFSRPDVIGVGLPLALTTAWMLLRRPRDSVMSIELHAHPEGSESSSEVVAVADAILDGDWLQVAIDQEEQRSGLADVKPRGGATRSGRRFP
jgi:hypothetical protein